MSRPHAAHLLGLGNGEAAILRNVGGRVVMTQTAPFHRRCDDFTLNVT